MASGFLESVFHKRLRSWFSFIVGVVVIVVVVVVIFLSIS